MNCFLRVFFGSVLLAKLSDAICYHPTVDPGIILGTGVSIDSTVKISTKEGSLVKFKCPTDLQFASPDKTTCVAVNNTFSRWNVSQVTCEDSTIIDPGPDPNPNPQPIQSFCPADMEVYYNPSNNDEPQKCWTDFNSCPTQYECLQLQESTSTQRFCCKGTSTTTGDGRCPANLKPYVHAPTGSYIECTLDQPWTCPLCDVICLPAPDSGAFSGKNFCCAPLYGLSGGTDTGDSGGSGSTGGATGGDGGTGGGTGGGTSGGTSGGTGGSSGGTGNTSGGTGGISGGSGTGGTSGGSGSGTGGVTGNCDSSGTVCSSADQCCTGQVCQYSWMGQKRCGKIPNLFSCGNNEACISGLCAGSLSKRLCIPQGTGGYEDTCRLGYPDCALQFRCAPTALQCVCQKNGGIRGDPPCCIAKSNDENICIEWTTANNVCQNDLQCPETYQCNAQNSCAKIA